MVFAVLQGKIVLFVFGKIQSLGLGGDPLEGVVAEFAAVVTVPDDSFFGAENGILIQFGSVEAVNAGTVDFLTKQHMYLSVDSDCLYYT